MQSNVAAVGQNAALEMHNPFRDMHSSSHTKYSMLGTFIYYLKISSWKRESNYEIITKKITLPLSLSLSRAELSSSAIDTEAIYVRSQ